MRRNQNSRYVTLTIAAAIWALPLVAMLVFSFAPNSEILKMSLWPSSFTIENYFEVLTTDIRGVSIPSSLINSVIILGVQVVGILLLDVPAAYIFARVSFPGREILFWSILVTMMMPGLIDLISLYDLMSNIGLIDTLPGIFLPGLARPIGIFLLRQFFRQIPKEFEEAARLDGATDFQIFSRIMVPLAIPAITTLGIITALYSWNNFLWPLVASNTPSSMPVPIAMAYLQQGTSPAQNYSVMLAAAVVTSLPMIIVFLIAQRWIVRGIQPASGIK
ncbi:MAG: carbohydrate ABC transporter permease [Pseudomonadota bacterium]